MFHSSYKMGGYLHNVDRSGIIPRASGGGTAPRSASHGILSVTGQGKLHVAYLWSACGSCGLGPDLESQYRV